MATDRGTSATRAGAPQYREQNGGGAGNQREHQAFSEKLRGELTAAGAERGPHGHFPRPSERTRQQEVADVGARHEENDHHCREHEDQRPTRVTDEGLPERNRKVLRALVLRAVLAFERGGECGEVGRRLIVGGVRLEPGHREDPPGFPSRRRGFRHAHREDQSRALLARWKAERGRGDADNLPQLGPDADAAPDDVGVGTEVALPGLVADHGDRRGALPRVGGGQLATERRRHAQRLEEAGRRRERRHAQRFAVTIEGRLPGTVPDERLDRRLAPSEVHVVANRDELFGDAGLSVAVIQDEQVLCVGVRQRPEQHRLDDGKDRDVRANAQSQRQDDRCAESRLANDHPERVTNVMPQHGAIRRAPAADSCPMTPGTQECRFISS